MAPVSCEYENTSIYKLTGLGRTQAGYTTHTPNNRHQYGKTEDRE
jgi:hypothetical protein